MCKQLLLNDGVNVFDPFRHAQHIDIVQESEDALSFQGLPAKPCAAQVQTTWASRGRPAPLPISWETPISSSHMYADGDPWKHLTKGRTPSPSSIVRSPCNIAFLEIRSYAHPIERQDGRPLVNIGESLKNVGHALTPCFGGQCVLKGSSGCFNLLRHLLRDRPGNQPPQNVSDDDPLPPSGFRSVIRPNPGYHPLPWHLPLVPTVPCLLVSPTTGRGGGPNASQMVLGQLLSWIFED